MFKVGDKVRCTEDCADLTEGCVYTIAGIFEESDDVPVDVGDPYVIDDVGDKQNAMIEGLFEKVKDQPVRTVTRREIVPGVYGRIKVFPTMIAGDVGLNFLLRDGSEVATTYPSLNAKELREVAHLFNQLAEALGDV